MENNNSEKRKMKIQDLCEDCNKLFSKEKDTEIHGNLLQTSFKQFSTHFGSIDEYYYKCKICPAVWLREYTGYGQGWQLLNRTA